MTSNDFLYLLLTGDYEKMPLEYYKILDKYDNIFKLGKKFSQMVISFQKKETEEKRQKIAAYIEEKIPLRFFILNRLDNYAIYEGDVVIDFKTRFYYYLNQMDTLRIFYLIDRISRLSEKYKINFFGHRSNEAIGYHKINEVISKAFGLQLVFDFFGRGNKKNFLHLPMYKIDRNLLIETLKEQYKLYFPILEGVSEFILDTKEEDLESRKEVLALNKKMKVYFDIIKREHKVLSGEVKSNNKTWKYLVDGIEVEDADFGEDFDYYYG